MGSISFSGDGQAPKVHNIVVNGSQGLRGLRAISKLLYSLPLKLSWCWYVVPHTNTESLKHCFYCEFQNAVQKLDHLKVILDLISFREKHLWNLK